MTHAYSPTVPGKVLQGTPTLDGQGDLLLLQLWQSPSGCGCPEFGHKDPQRYFSLVLTIRVLQNPKNFQTFNFVRVV